MKLLKIIFSHASSIPDLECEVCDEQKINLLLSSFQLYRKSVKMNKQKIYFSQTLIKNFRNYF